jgi:hypothetical protein
MDKADAALVQHFAVLVHGVDDHEARLVIGEMTFDQRQGALADRAKADHYDRPINVGVNRPFRHVSRLQS